LVWVGKTPPLFFFPVFFALQVKTLCGCGILFVFSCLFLLGTFLGANGSCFLTLLPDFGLATPKKGWGVVFGGVPLFWDPFQPFFFFCGRGPGYF